MAAFHGAGWCVFLYPVLLSWTLTGRTPKAKVKLAATWGIVYAAAFYLWAGAYGLLPWLALSLARGLPWALFPLPAILLARKLPSPARGLGWAEVVGGALGLSLVSTVLLAGITGVDWETPAAALTAWPTMLSPLRWVGLGSLALAIGLVSHLLGSGRFGLIGAGALLLLVWWAGAPRLALADSPSDSPVPRIALVQTGYAQELKWDEKHRAVSVEQLLLATEQAAANGAQLVIWPETCWPYRGLRQRLSHTRRIGKTARRLGVDILVSSIEEVPGQADPEWLNTVSLVLRAGSFSGHYEKRRLAPFAEYLPLPAGLEEILRGIRPFSRISRYVPGSSASIFTTSDGQRFATLICFESMTPAMAAEMAPEADFLVVVTNDAPFAHSPANEAHFRSAILRAIETERPVLQAANTGVTGAISPSGRVWTRTETGFSGPAVQYLPP